MLWPCYKTMLTPKGRDTVDTMFPFLQHRFLTFHSFQFGIIQTSKYVFKKTTPHHRAWVHVPPFLAMEIRSINASQKIRPNTLPETNIFAPKNGWLEYFLVSFWGPKRLFSGANLLLVSGSVAGISSQQRQGPTKV